MALAILEVYPYGDGLEHATAKSLMDAGATEKQASRILASFRFVRVCDAACQARASVLQVNRPSVAADVVRSAVGNAPQEFFVAILLDARQRVLDVIGVAIGSLSSVDVHPRELFRDAVRRGAHSVILAHNHPSGSSTPSDADIKLTERMKRVGDMMGIPVLDHIVVAPSEHTSLAQMGLA